MKRSELFLRPLGHGGGSPLLPFAARGLLRPQKPTAPMAPSQEGCGDQCFSVLYKGCTELRLAEIEKRVVQIEIFEKMERMTKEEGAKILREIEVQHRLSKDYLVRILDKGEKMAKELENIAKESSSMAKEILAEQQILEAKMVEFGKEILAEQQILEAKMVEFGKREFRIEMMLFITLGILCILGFASWKTKRFLGGKYEEITQKFNVIINILKVARGWAKKAGI